MTITRLWCSRLIPSVINIKIRWVSWCICNSGAVVFGFLHLPPAIIIDNSAADVLINPRGQQQSPMYYRGFKATGLVAAYTRHQDNQKICPVFLPVMESFSDSATLVFCPRICYWDHIRSPCQKKRYEDKFTFKIFNGQQTICIYNEGFTILIRFFF